MAITYHKMNGIDLSHFIDSIQRDAEYRNHGEYVAELYSRIKYLSSIKYDVNRENLIYFIAYDTDTKFIVGVVCLKTKGFDSVIHPGWKNWISYVSIDPNYQHRGLAKYLIEQCFIYANINSIKILISEYTVKGFMYIKPHIARCSKKYDVEILDPYDKPGHFDFYTCEGMDRDTYHQLVEILKA